jgi:hypothetical protein
MMNCRLVRDINRVVRHGDVDQAGAIGDRDWMVECGQIAETEGGCFIR